MSSIASQVPPTPLPDRAWNGRSWWFSCCSGCCLVFLIVIGLAFFIGGWSTKNGASWLKSLNQYIPR